MNRNVLVQEFLDEISQRAEVHFRGHSHQAFLSWYVEAEFGRVEWSFTDDVNDGGIDAIVWRPEEVPAVILIQSKFAERVGGALLSQAAYLDLAKVVQAFRHRAELFDDFLSRVRDDLRHPYRKACERLADHGNWIKVGRRSDL